MVNKAFFLDRDGVLNVEVSYLGDPEKMELLPGAAQAVKLLHQTPALMCVQIGHGRLLPSLIRKLHQLQIIQHSDKRH